MSEPYRALARKHLDPTLDALRGLESSPPGDSWIRSIRTSLGMSTLDLASRMGVSKQRISQYEAAEQAGTIKLETMERVAAALGARLHYAVVPDLPLAEMVSKRARQLAERELAAVEHSMDLENQKPERATEELIANRARELEGSTRLWSDSA